MKLKLLTILETVTLALFYSPTISTAESLQDKHYSEERRDGPNVEDLIDSFSYRHRLLSSHNRRQLTHTIPPEATPNGCTYSYNHAGAPLVLWDQIFCPNKCGSGKDFTFLVTTHCDSDGTNCDTVADCRVNGCTDSCGKGVGECPCPTQSFDKICARVCGATRNCRAVGKRCRTRKCAKFSACCCNKRQCQGGKSFGRCV